MCLERLADCRPNEVELPSSARRLIESAWDTIHDFMHRMRRNPVKGFQPSDFEEAYQWMATVRALVTLDDSPGFCEWGSGFGVVSALAAQLGFAATAIESDSDLFEAGVKWQTSVGAKVKLLHGSFVPRDQIKQLTEEAQKGMLGPRCDSLESMWLDLEADSIFDRAEVAPDDFDVVYAYPWPDEEAFLFRLFELVAKPGTLLLTFHGAADFRLTEKKHTDKKDRQINFCPDSHLKCRNKRQAKRNKGQAYLILPRLTFS